MGYLSFCQINGINLHPASIQLLYLKQIGIKQIAKRSFFPDQTEFTAVF